MNLVSLIADQVQTRQDLFSNEGKIMDVLMSGGYHLQEADAAITLMQTLARETAHAVERTRAFTGIRSMSTEERNRFALDAFGLVIKLAVLGIIDEDQREDIIEKALSLHRGKIDLASVKTLLALNLFGDPGDYQDLLSVSKHRPGSSWN